VLLPNTSLEYVPTFLSLLTWADFRNGQDHDLAFHVLKQGIKGEPRGRWPPKSTDAPDDVFAKYEQKFLELEKFQELLDLHEDLVIEFKRKILDRWLDE
jgi:hypothetical protein